MAGKTLTNQQQIIQQRHLIGHQAIQQQQQQLRMQKLNITVGFLLCRLANYFLAVMLKTSDKKCFWVVSLGESVLLQTIFFY